MLTSQGLLSVDIYSLGMTVWNLLTSNMVRTVLKMDIRDLIAERSLAPIGKVELMGLIIWKTPSKGTPPLPSAIIEGERLFAMTNGELEDVPKLFRHAAKLDVNDAVCVLDPDYAAQNMVQGRHVSENETSLNI